MTGTITHFQRARGLGTLLGDDGKSYSFRRNDVREVWSRKLTEGVAVAFEPGKQLSATEVRPITAPV